MKNSWLFFLLSLTTTFQAVSVPIDEPDRDDTAYYEKKNATGPFYTPETIYQFDIAGFKLGMTQDEIAVKVKNDKWQGQFQKYKLDPNMPLYGESETKSFFSENKDLFFFRHWAKGKTPRLHAIGYSQEFKTEHNIDDTIKSLIEKFGEPTFRKQTDPHSQAYLTWRPVNLTEGMKCDGCKSNKDFKAYETKYSQLANVQKDYPFLRAVVRVNSVELGLVSPELREKDLKEAQEEIDAENKVKRDANNKAEKPQF